ncbi:MAG TPA: DUF1269 domain-containing protein [Gemmatimonadaceae bacterium]|nr:DUF1269 domain-containing protein [Gemmatimonadaceae bacterium]
MKPVGEQLQPGSAAVCALVRRSTPDKVLDELSKFRGAVLRTSLSREAGERLQVALRHAGAPH